MINMESLKTKTAIIVSQSLDYQTKIEEFLKVTYGFGVIVKTPDASMANRMIENQVFQLIIIDYDLLKMNGLILIQRLAKLGVIRGASILFVTKTFDTIQKEFSRTLEIDYICETKGEIELIYQAIDFIFEIITWSKELNTGIRAIDEEHLNLYQMIYFIRNNDISKEEILEDIFEKLENHCIHHFKEEEDLMRQLNYPHLEKHIKKHQVLTLNLQLLKNSISGSRLSRSELQLKVYTLVKRWFKQHLLKDDLPFLKILKKRNLRSAVKVS